MTLTDLAVVEHAKLPNAPNDQGTRDECMRSIFWSMHPQRGASTVSLTHINPQSAKARTGLTGDRVAAEPELAQGRKPVQLVDARPLPKSLCIDNLECGS